MTPTALPLALALFFQPADPSEQYVLIRVQPVGIHEPAEVVRRRLTERLRQPERSIRLALQSPEVAPLLVGQPTLALWVAESVGADWPGEGEILRLRLRARGPTGGVLLSAVADAFVRLEVDKERRDTEVWKAILQGDIDEFCRLITEKERLLRTLPRQTEEDRQRMRKEIEQLRTSMHELQGRIGRLERAVEFGWPQATVFRCKP
jgi:hypothetical protein